jgi:GNAT superfamily N-acetyltransferase
MIKVAELPARDAEQALPALANVLLDAVADGASVGFMHDITLAEAEDFWRRAIAGITAGETLLFVAYDAGELVGTVLLNPCAKPNQPHRADVAKLLVLSRARRGGIASQLMQALETRACALGRTLLTLDTASGSAAEAFYRRRGYQRAGEIPGYTLMPNGALNGTTFYYKNLG